MVVFLLCGISSEQSWEDRQPIDALGYARTGELAESRQDVREISEVIACGVRGNTTRPACHEGHAQASFIEGSFFSTILEARLRVPVAGVHAPRDRKSV